MKKNEPISDTKSKKRTKTNSSEPYFYIGLILKGTEKEYLNLLKYINNKNGSQIIYQNKSLTYLRISRESSTNTVKPTTQIDTCISQEAIHQ